MNFKIDAETAIMNNLIMSVIMFGLLTDHGATSFYVVKKSVLRGVSVKFASGKARISVVNPFL